MKTYHTCTGEIRGRCRTEHKTIEAAEKCLERDQSRCKTFNGVSDRKIVYFNGFVFEPVEGLKNAV